MKMEYKLFCFLFSGWDWFYFDVYIWLQKLPLFVLLLTVGFILICFIHNISLAKPSSTYFVSFGYFYEEFVKKVAETGK